MGVSELRLIKIEKKRSYQHFMVLFLGDCGIRIAINKPKFYHRLYNTILLGFILHLVSMCDYKLLYYTNLLSFKIHSFLLSIRIINHQIFKF